MTSRRQLCFGLLACAACVTSVCSCGANSGSQGKPPAAASIPAEVPHVLNEAQINTITLTAEAIERLNLQYGKIERQPVRRVRMYGGEILVPPGKAILVAAPLSGVLKAPDSGVPQPGETVEKGSVLFQLMPLLSPESRVTLDAAKTDAEGQLETTNAQFNAARIALDRAKRVLQSEAGSRRAVDEAQAQFDVAREAVDAAQARLALLEKAVGASADGTAASLEIVAPQAGLLRSVSALAEQNVPAGAQLFEIVNLEQVWVRVPVYVGDLKAVDRSTAAAIVDFTAPPNQAGIAAQPVVGPPAANPTAGTVDEFYAFDNRESLYNPGQRVGVNLTLQGETTSLTVPWSAIVSDIQGGSWVYAKAGERTFERRRVSPRYVMGNVMVLADGPDAGVEVVIAGAAELFGTETGFSK